MMRSIKSLGGLTRRTGMNEAVRNLWIGTLHDCSKVGQAMQNITLTKKQTNDQDLAHPDVTRDFEDLMIFCNWFEKFDPFATTNSGLKSLATGLTARDNSEINCANAESIGHTLQQSIDDLPITEAKIAVRRKIKTLVNLTKGLDVDSRLVFIDPIVLFMRLIVLVERPGSNRKYFGFELTSYPTSLFKDHFMRHPKKSVLADVLKMKQSHHKGKKRKLKDTDMEIEAESTNNEDQLVNKEILLEDHVIIDAGALLHQVYSSGSTFQEVINEYRR